MIFKDIQIYFLSASAVIRWGFTLSALMALIAFWYLSAFAPLLQRYSLMQSKIAQQYVRDQENELLVDQQAKNKATTSQRLWFAGSSHDFLKDLLNAGLICTHANLEKIDHYDIYNATHAKITLEGVFEKFYDFCKTHHKNYLCQWNSIICQLNPAGKLVINADITIYSPLK